MLRENEQLSSDDIERLAKVGFDAWTSEEVPEPPYPFEEASPYLKRHWRTVARAIANAALDDLAKQIAEVVCAETPTE